MQLKCGAGCHLGPTRSVFRVRPNEEKRAQSGAPAPPHPTPHPQAIESPPTSETLPSSNAGMWCRRKWGVPAAAAILPSSSEVHPVYECAVVPPVPRSEAPGCGHAKKEHSVARGIYPPTPPSNSGLPRSPTQVSLSNVLVAWHTLHTYVSMCLIVSTHAVAETR